MGKKEKTGGLMDSLVKAATEMNTVMGLDPAITVENVTEADLKAKVIAEGNLADAKDKLSDDTWALFRELGTAKTALAAREAKPAPAAKATAKATPAKPAPAAKATPAKEPKAPKAPKEPKAPRYTRASAFADAVRAGCNTEEKLLERADALYVKKMACEPNPKEALWIHRFGMAVLKELGIVSETNGKLAFKL